MQPSPKDCGARVSVSVAMNGLSWPSGSGNGSPALVKRDLACRDNREVTSGGAEMTKWTRLRSRPSVV